MEEFGTLAGLVAISSVKFLFAPGASYLLGYSYLQTLLITMSGGIGGVLTFFFFGEGVKIAYFRLFPKKVKADRKKFTRRNKLIVRIKGNYGLLGLAIVTPCILSIPLGSLIAVRYFDHDKRTLPSLIISVIVWSLVLTSITYSIA